MKHFFKNLKKSPNIKIEKFNRLMESLKLILIRHGETVENASHIVQGHLPGQLSDKGREQVLWVAGKLIGEKFNAVYSSDLERAFQTTKILMEDREIPPIITDPRLREQNFGIYEGKPVMAVLRQMKREKADFITFKPEGGESFENFRNRVKSFIEDIKAKHFGHTVSLVTHFGVINILLGIFLNQNTEKIPENNIPNGTIIIVNLDRLGNVEVETINFEEDLCVL